MDHQIAYLNQLKQMTEIYQFMVKLCWLKTITDRLAKEESVDQIEEPKAKVKRKRTSGSEKNEAEVHREKSACKSLSHQEKTQVSTIAASEVIKGRMYDFNNGRFLSVDPFIQGTSSQAINPYSYIQNNPLSGVDPTGYKIVAESYECGKGEGQFNCGALLAGMSPTAAKVSVNSGKDSDGSKVKSVTTDIANIEVPDDCDAFGCTALRKAKETGGHVTIIFMPDGRTMVDFERKEKLSTHLLEDLESGQARDRIEQAMKAEVSILAGGLEIVLAFNPISGTAGGFFVGMHGAGNVSEGVGNYINIFDGGSRDGNIVRQGYENLAQFAGASEEFGATSFYVVDFAMGVGALATPIKVPFREGQYSLDVPELAGGYIRVPAIRAYGAGPALRDSVILTETALQIKKDELNHQKK